MLSETVRFLLAKRGRLKFISHLDLCRTMRSAMIRAEIPIWYTEGFNPHPRMAFALPLSVGAESEYELMDLKVIDTGDIGSFASRLDAATAPELYIKEAYIPETKFTSIESAEYSISIELPYSDKTAEIFAKPLILPKRTKKGVTDTDIIPFIRGIAVSERADGFTSIDAVLSASGDAYLNPEYIVRAVESGAGISKNGVEYSICRTGIIDAAGNLFR